MYGVIIVVPIHFGQFLNQVCASQRPTCAWFLEIAFVHNVCMCACVCVCPPTMLLMTSGVIYCDKEPL